MDSSLSALLFSCVAVCIFAAADIDFQHAPEITIVQNEDLDPSLALVHNTRQCGGPGKLLDWRLEGCNSTDANNTCQFLADGKFRRCEIGFLPSQNITQLGKRVLVSVNGTEQKEWFKIDIANSSVVGDEPAILKTAGAVGKEFVGSRLTAQYIIFRVDTKEVEVCGEVDLQVV